MTQLFDASTLLLDDMTKVNQAWHTNMDKVSSQQSGISKEQMEKDHERNENITNMMTQLDFLYKHVMGGGPKTINAVGTSTGQ